MNHPETDSEYIPVYRNINGYYTFHLFINMAFWLPIYAIFFLGKGLSYSEILVLYAVMNGVQTVLEIPSGALADRWGRKPALMLGALLQTAGNSLIAFGNGLIFFLAGMVLCGVALAFISGSDAAFIYDTLKGAGRGHEFKKTEGRAYMYNLFGWGSAGLLGGFLAAQNISLPFFLTAIASFLAFLTMGICTEPKRETTDSVYPVRPAMDLIVDAWRLVRKKRLVLMAILFNAVIIGTLLVKHKFSQPYLQAAGIDLAYFGVIYFVWLIFAAASSYLSEKTEKYLGGKIYFVSIPILTGLVMIYLGFFQNWGGIVLILLHQYAWGSLRPQINQIVNQETPTAIRATVLSIAGFGASMVYIIAVPVFGLIADQYDFMLSLMCLGIATIVIGSGASIYLLRQFAGMNKT